MAIPFNLPSDQETENNYQSMDDVLLQLYWVLRDILFHRARVAEAQVEEPRQEHHHHHMERRGDAVGTGGNREGASSLPDVIPRLPLPDLVPAVTARQASSAATTAAPTSAAQPAPRRTRRRRQRPRDPPEKGERTSREPFRGKVRDNWTQVGDDLRGIADEFRSKLQVLGPKRETQEESSAQKSFSLLSMLAPPPFRGSIWMAVIFLFGWGVLQRTTR